MSIDEVVLTECNWIFTVSQNNNLPWPRRYSGFNAWNLFIVYTAKPYIFKKSFSLFHFFQFQVRWCIFTDIWDRLKWSVRETGHRRTENHFSRRCERRSAFVFYTNIALQFLWEPCQLFKHLNILVFLTIRLLLLIYCIIVFIAFCKNFTGNFMTQSSRWVKLSVKTLLFF